MNGKPTVIDMGEGREVAAPVALAETEIDRQIATAKAYPRSVEAFRNQVRALATLNEEIAGQCLYAMPRDGKVIEGPSIRFAEILVASWGNCRVASSILGEDGGFVKAGGLFWDLESNSATGFEVRRRITNREGRRYGDDMIATTGNAAAAIARRNATLGGIPKAIWWDLYLAAKAHATGGVATLSQRRQKAMEAFKKFGVTEAQVLATLGVSKIGEIDLDHLAKLQGFYTAITVEERDPTEIFAAVETASERAAAPKPAPKAPEKRSELEKSVAAMLDRAESEADVIGLKKLFQKEIAEADEIVAGRVITLIDEAAKQFSSAGHNQAEGGAPSQDGSRTAGGEGAPSRSQGAGR